MRERKRERDKERGEAHLCRLRFVERDEAEAARLAGLLVARHHALFEGAVLLEDLAEAVVGGVVRQASHEEGALLIALQKMECIQPSYVARKKNASV